MRSRRYRGAGRLGILSAVTVPRLPVTPDAAPEPDERTAPVDPWRSRTTLEEPDADELGREGGTLKDYFSRMQERGLLD